MSQQTGLFQLPAEIRNKIWSLVVGNLNILPVNGPAEVRDDPGQAMCNTCQQETPRSPPAMSHLHSISPLCACKQLYREAYPILRDTMTLQINACHLLGTVRLAPQSLRSHLRHLRLYCHLNSGTREIWMTNLTDLHHQFPALRTLTIHAHLRPPIAYENLVDAIYLCGPLVHLPKLIEQRLHFQYIEDSVMFFREEFGTVYYHDALDEHEKVVRELLADDAFRHFPKNRDRTGLPEDVNKPISNAYALELMTARLLQIAREHEQPWIDSLRAKREREIKQQERSKQEWATAASDRIARAESSRPSE